MNRRTDSLPVSAIDSAPFRLGDWLALPAENGLTRAGLRVQIEPRCMDVLLCLARANGAVVSADQLLDECWAGIDTGDNPLHKTIAQLRRVLGDSATAPHYIETIRKRGYRVLVPVEFLVAEETLIAPPLPAMSSSPFRGLEPFDADHATSFFGRDQAIAELMQKVERQCEIGSGFLLALGASGCGKTSLLRAGLLTRLRALPEGHPARPAAVVQLRPDDGADARQPWRALAARLTGALPAASAADAAAGPAVDADWLSLSPDAAVGALLARHAGLPEPPPGRLYLLIDPFEQFFTLPGFTPEVLAAQLTLLAALAACPRVFVLAACRNEFYPQITRLPELMRLKAGAGQYDVPAPTPGELAQMIRYPATAAGLGFEVKPGGEHLDDVLRDAASQGKEVLPLLEYALDELYLRRSERGLLTFAAYEAMGGVEGAIGKRAEQTVAGLAPSAQAALGRLLSRLVVTGADDHVGGRRVRFAELGDTDERQLLDALVAARLVVTEFFDGEPCFSASHEALFRHWPRVTDWVQRHRAALRLRASVAPLVARWQAEGQSADFLLPPGRQLEEAGELLGGSDLELADAERAWLAASARRAALLRRRRRLGIAALALLAVVSSLLAIAAWNAREAAVERRREAEGLMSFMLGTLADKLRPIGRLELLNDVSEQALHFLADDRRDADLPTRMAHARALQVGAEVEQARGHVDTAEQQLRAALALLPAVPAGIDDPALLRLLGELHFWLGQLAFDRRDWPAASLAFEQYRASAERWLALQPDDRGARQELAYALNSLGSVALEANRSADALAYFRRSVDLKLALRTGHEDDDALTADLGDSIAWLAATLRRELRIGEIERETARAAALLVGVAERRPGEGQWLARAATLLSVQASARIELGDEAGAAPLLQRASGYARRALAIDDSRLPWLIQASQVDCALARLPAPAGGATPDGARSVIAGALARLARRTEAGTDLDAREQMAHCERALAHVETEAGRLPDAAGAIERGLAHAAGSPALTLRLWLDRLALAQRSHDAARIDAAQARLRQLDAADGAALPAPLRLEARLALLAAPATPDSTTRQLIERLRRSDYRERGLLTLAASRGIDFPTTAREP
ncbi:nSTAND1 domain-containing NTPase [Derxia lacustris]|uniref:nSTAND1 domain-containing NTPase n=1 Tax=Derxia lacustris TaxID=764842 RepID=UPI000A16D7FC|nr:winged helix-turn-helix domain-containing protein [Derxia lacustris]